MNVREQLAEAALDFQRRSAAKHNDPRYPMMNGGYAFIDEIGPYKGIISRLPGTLRYVLPPQPSRWQIVYVQRNGPTTQGIVIGTTRVQALRWLRNHKKRWC